MEVLHEKIYATKLMFQLIFQLFNWLILFNIFTSLTKNENTFGLSQNWFCQRVFLEQKAEGEAEAVQESENTRFRSTG